MAFSLDLLYELGVALSTAHSDGRLDQVHVQVQLGESDDEIVTDVADLDEGTVLRDDLLGVAEIVNVLQEDVHV